MTTVAGAIEATRRHLLGSFRPELNLLEGSHSSSVSQVTVELPLVGLNTGSYVAIDDEIMFVTSVDSGAKQFVVIRGMLGSEAAAHSDAALVEINPLFPRFFIKEALKEEIRSWPEDLFRVEYLVIDGGSGVRSFDLDYPDFYSVLDVNRAPYATEVENADRRIPFTIQRIADNERFPSGQALLLRSPLDVDASLLVSLAVPYDVSTFDETTDLEDVVGIHAAAHDIPPIGAAWRLTIGRELRRTFGEGQGEPRRSEEVPATANFRASEALRETRDRRLSHERARLRGRWPYRNG